MTHTHMSNPHRATLANETQDSNLVTWWPHGREDLFFGGDREPWVGLLLVWVSLQKRHVGGGK